MITFWKAAVGVAGLGAVGAFVFYGLYKDFINLPIFEKLSADQTFSILKLFLFLTFVSLIAMLGTWLISKKAPSGETGPTVFNPPPNATFRTVMQGLAETDKAAVSFHGFTDAELNLLVKPGEISSETLESAFRMVGKLTNPQLSYTVEKKDSSFEITKKT